MKILSVFNNTSDTNIPYELHNFMSKAYIDHSFKSICRADSLWRTLILFISEIRSADIIHSHQTFTSLVVSLAYILGHFKENKCFLLTLHRDFHTFRLLQKVSYVLLIFPFRDLIVCNSQTTLGSLPKFIRFLYRKKLLVVYNGVDLKKIRRTTLEMGKPIRLVNVGRLISDKDQITLIKLCTVLRIKGIDFVLTICGDGPQREFLQAKTQQLQLDDHIVFKGHMSRLDVYKELSNSDVYISCSKTEGFGNSNIEAMASGCAVILTDLPVNLELIESGEFLFPIGDYLRCYEILYSLINNRNKSKSSVETLIKIAEKYSIEFAAYNYMNLYLRSMNAKIPSSV